MMEREAEGYEVGFSDATGDWYVVHRQWKGSVLHHNILADRYDTEDAANEAAAALQAG